MTGDPDVERRHWFELVLAYADHSTMRRKVELRTEELTADPEAWDARVARGNLYLDLGFAARAIVEYDRALRSSTAPAPPPPIVLYNRGIARGFLGDHRGAMEELTAALGQAPASAAVLFTRGLAKQLAGLIEEAIADYDEAAAIDPAFALTFHHRSCAHAELGLLDEQQRDLELASAIAPELARAELAAADPPPRAPGGDEAVASRLCFSRARAVVARCHGRLDEPQTFLHREPHRIVFPPPDRAGAFDHYARADAYRQLLEDGRAVERFNERLRERPDHEASLLGRAFASFRSGDHAHALADFAEVAQRHGPRWASEFLAGLLHGAAGDCPRAVEHLSESLERRPSHAAAHLARAFAHRDMGDAEGTRLDLESATQLDPQFIPEACYAALAGLAGASDVVAPRRGPPTSPIVPAPDPVTVGDAPAAAAAGGHAARRLPHNPPAGVERGVRVFLDTSSLMHADCERFFEQWLIPVSEQPLVRVFVPAKVLEELGKHVRGPHPGKRGAAEAATRLVDEHRAAGRLLVAGDADDTFADNLFQYLFTRFRLEHDLCLVTQDRGLAEDILALRDSRSVRTDKRISAFRIGQGGPAQNWGRILAGGRPGPPPAKPTTTVAATPTPAFALVAGPVELDATPLPAPGPVRRGMYLMTAGRQTRVRLIRRVAAGGEGTIYTTDGGLAGKIYDVKSPVASTRAKLELMCSRPLEHASICWPREILFNRFEHFVGYTMPLADGRVLGDVIRPSELPAAFPGWDRVNLTTLVLTVLEVIAHLNSAGVLLGDINPNNFIVTDERTVRLVDTDSYQIEQFPCTVYMPPFLHPELVGKDLRTTMRTRKHEHFAIATLIFRMLMLGQSPYAHRGGGSPEENVLKGKFPYPGAGRKGQGVPQGGWGRLWSYFPGYLKERFHAVFSEHQDIAAAEWISHLERYRALLRRHDDPQARMLVPDLYRRVWVPGQPVPDGYVVRECLNSACAQKEYVEKVGSKSAVALCAECRVKEAVGTCGYYGCGARAKVRLRDYFTVLGGEIRCSEHWPRRVGSRSRA